MNTVQLHKEYINLPDVKSPVDDLSPQHFAADPAVSKFKVHAQTSQEFPNDPQADQEAIDSIEKDYFNGDDFDASRAELDKLPDVLELQAIDEDRSKLRGQLRAVSKKVSELVLENHPAYAAELIRVMELQQSLQTASVVCANGRRYLSNAKEDFTTASLGLLANYRKRQQLVGLLKSLKTIKTLQRTDIRLREMLEEEDYPGAIQLCLECQKAASTFRHFHCISELSSKLKDTLEMIEEALDVALSKTCNNFDTRHYEKVQTAYRLLGKTQTAMDQLNMHFASAIHNTAFTIVIGYVELCSGTEDSNFQKRQYLDLCEHISPDLFTPCLIDLCKALWEVMKSYYQTMLWHEKHDLEPTDQESGSSNVEAAFNRRYIKQKLEHGLGRIWQDVQQKVRLYVLKTDLSYFKFDEFIKVLDLLNRLIEIGEEFCGSKSEALQESIRTQSLNYFKSYHRARMDELRMFLENEGWELCPVKSSFATTQLQEFRFLRHKCNKMSPAGQTISSQSVDPEKPVRPNYGYFQKYLDVGNPFDVQIEDEETEDVLATNGYGGGRGRQNSMEEIESDSDEDVPDELKQDFIDENTGDTPSRPMYRRRKLSNKSGARLPPIITNTTLTLLRLFGKYMQMMNVLKPIAFDVMICMSKLFDYYLYAVYSFFAIDASESSGRSLGSRLRTTLKRIEDNLILLEPQFGAPPPTAEEIRSKVAHPHLSPIVDLTSAEGMHGLGERIIAVESLVFLADQFQFLQPHLEGMIPQNKKAFLQQFYSQTVGVTPELRQPVYTAVAARSIDYDQLIQLMASVRWDIKDIMSQHSTYVDQVLRDFHIFAMKLDNLSKRVPMPVVVSCCLWELCITLANTTFVEGYASAKKCTTEGRALMLLDFQQFLMKLEKLTELRPIPEREYVETYIKAYYLPEDQLETWVKDHKEYTTKQIISLVNCLPHINKRARQRIIGVIEETRR
ncbi:syndetin-like [Lineus longissimus]|uniref:syndetin-like n=1 Tax=Lineus longissimus TaxID=88925 RepID=UPI00315DC7E3